MTKTRPPANYRERLVQALAVVIARDGFSGAKIQDIVKEAKVSLRTFYAEFPNKEACFLALHAQIIEAMGTTITHSVTFDRPWREVMRHSFEVYFHMLTAQPRLTHAVTIELATLSEEARRAREVAMDGFARQVCDLVDEGRRANPDIPSRPLDPIMARAILGAVNELVMSRVVRDEIDSLPELIDTTTDMLFSVVTNPATAVPLNAAADAAKHPNSGVAADQASTGAGVRR